jgi:hypothetical protein
MRSARRIAACLRLSAFAAAAAALLACASSQPPAPEEAVRPALDRVFARLVSKGELEKTIKLADSLAVSKDPTEREISAYWEAVAFLYRDEPDSALALLEPQQGKWSAGLRRVHGALLLKLARESSAARAASHWRPEDAAPKPTPDKGLQDRVEALQKESSDLRAENLRLATEKEKYQKLLKDLETIR